MPTAIDGLSGSWPATQSQGATESALQALGGIGSEGFLKLLVAQLRYQSPLEPSDPGDLMVQTAQLAQLDATQQLIALQQRDLGLQQAVAAAGLVGAEVTATGADGLPVQGIVDAVRYTQAGPVLEIAGREVAMGAVTEIRRPGGSDASTTPVSGESAAGEPGASVPAAGDLDLEGLTPAEQALLDPDPSLT